MLSNNEFDNNLNSNRLECKRWVKSTKGRAEMRSKLMACRWQPIIIMEKFRGWEIWKLYNKEFVTLDSNESSFLSNCLSARWMEILFDFQYVILKIFCWHSMCMDGPNAWWQYFRVPPNSIAQHFNHLKRILNYLKCSFKIIPTSFQICLLFTVHKRWAFQFINKNLPIQYLNRSRKL